MCMCASECAQARPVSVPPRILLIPALRKKVFTKGPANEDIISSVLDFTPFLSMPGSLK